MDRNYADINANNMPQGELGTLIRLSMAQQRVSTRQLSKLSGISAATISRIINGKQAASIQHMQEISKHLGLPIKKLLQSVGVIDIEESQVCGSFAMENIQEIINDLKINLDSVASDIMKELDKLEHYARTKEGIKIILDGFPVKISTIDSAGAIINKLNYFYAQFCSDNINEDKKAVIGSALLYFTLTIGVIPDYYFPIGYLDDAMAVKMVEKKLLQMG